jgi:hypothetical protein
MESELSDFHSMYSNLSPLARDTCEPEPSMHQK